MLETKCVDDIYKMLVTVLTILVTNIHYLLTLALATNIKKMSSTSKFRHCFSQLSNSTKIINLREPKERFFFVFLVDSVGNIDVGDGC